MVFFYTKKKLVSTGFEPTTSRSPAKRLIHLSYENIWIYSSINLLFICAITRAFPSEPPNVNPDSGTPPRVFYRPVLVLACLACLARLAWCLARLAASHVSKTPANS